MGDKRKAFVTGWPVDHSRSPLIHQHWLKEHGIEGKYTKLPCKPESFSAFIKSFHNDGFAGGNVTVPHKEMAFQLADHCDETATRLGAVNTIWREDGRTVGSNTDGYGFLANLDEKAPGWDSKPNLKRGALVLGAGGASRAIIDGLLHRGFAKIVIANRTVERADKLAKKFGTSCISVDIQNISDDHKNVAVAINTTSIGMKDGGTPVDLKSFPADMIVNDIVYTPLKTPFLAQAEQLGMKTVDGLGMLLHQAVPGFERWFGVRPKVTEELRTIVLRDLGHVA